MATKSNAEEHEDVEDEEEGSDDKGSSHSSEDSSDDSIDVGSLDDHIRDMVEQVLGERRPRRAAPLDTQRSRENSVAALVRQEQQKIADESAAKEKSEETERRINALELAANPPKAGGWRGWLGKHFWGNP